MSKNIENQAHISQEIEFSEANNYSVPEIQPPTPKQPKFVWLFVDLLCLGAVGLACLLFKLVASPYRQGFYCDDDSISKPFKDSTVPSWVLYSVGFTLAYLVILITECFNDRKERRSGLRREESRYKFGPLAFKSVHTELFRLIVSFAFGGLITIFVTDIGKYAAGRLRPHFLSICNAPPSVFINCSHNYIMDDVCTGDPGLLREGRLSFPSGHASFSGTLLF